MTWSKVVLAGWSDGGLAKVALSYLLVDFCGVRLAEAKARVDAFLETERLEVFVDSDRLDAFVAVARGLGAIVRPDAPVPSNPLLDKTDAEVARMLDEWLDQHQDPNRLKSMGLHLMKRLR